MWSLGYAANDKMMRFHGCPCRCWPITTRWCRHWNFEFAALNPHIISIISWVALQVLANNNEMVLMPVNEPTFGTKRCVEMDGGLDQDPVRAQVHVWLCWPSPCPLLPSRQQAPALSSCCRKSQIQTFLEQNEGPGLQHLALKTDDIFRAMREMRARCAAHAGQAGLAGRWCCGW